jgi:hypothetical protein
MQWSVQSSKRRTAGGTEKLLETHETWIKAGRLKPNRINLYGIVLTKLDLSGADLQEALLRDADLTGTDLTRANLQTCRPIESDARGSEPAGSRSDRSDTGPCRSQQSVSSLLCLSSRERDRSMRHTDVLYIGCWRSWPDSTSARCRHFKWDGGNSTLEPGWPAYNSGNIQSAHPSG